MRASAGLLIALVGASSLAGAAAPKATGTVSFNRDVRPILADNCFVCHGPDAESRMANLRLDERESALGQGVIVPGKPEQSRLVARVFAAEEGRRMPPVSTHKRLTAAQKETLRRWVAQGARYERHWSFAPLPARVAPPAVKTAAWPRSDLDRFVLARLERERLSPSPDAAATDWVRRVTLDLTGLPPTPAEVDAFLADRAAGARERVVDRLLKSPRYGERMAVPWLDLARYADSYGYQSDQLCTTWPYRDWVIKAFNENLSYDRFITLQLAGDLLPGASGSGHGSEPPVGRGPRWRLPLSPSAREQRLATAFNRLHRMTNEGGSVPEEWRLEGVADRVHTFGTAFLGLTLECARCHDHKYDPISQRDYYALSAFFNSIDEHGLYDRADIVPSPSLLLPTPEQEAEEKAAREAASRAGDALSRARVEREPAFQTWLVKTQKAAITDRFVGCLISLWFPADADLVGRFDFEEFEGTKLPNRVKGAARHGARQDEVPLVESHNGKAAAFDGENNVHFPELARFERHTPFTIAFRMWDTRVAAEPAVVFQACSGTDTGPHGYDLLLEEGHLTARLFRHWPGNAIGVRAKVPVRKERWTDVAVTYDGSSRAEGLRIYLNGIPVEQEILRDRLTKGTGKHTLVFGQRFRDRGFKGGQIDELRIYARALTSLEAMQLREPGTFQVALEKPWPHVDALRDYYFSAEDPVVRELAAALAAARGRVVAAEDAQTEVAVMEAMRQPRPAWVLRRGQYDAPKEEANRVARETPAGVLPFPKTLPRDRLGLARWLVRPEHPLTARVAVNRIWALFFGQGLVETAENFGLQGQLPSHPELLDWLARDFVRSGWNVKALVKKIALSRTYGQASALTPELRRRDPGNVLLARGPSHRLSAEAIRDTALAASGLLGERIGGPSVSPYQPGDLWRESNTMSPAYKQGRGADLYRRSLYTVWKRTAPIPNVLAFDAAGREVCVARRQATNTPLQALVLLNDPQFVEAARVLGERAVKEGGATPAARARFAFRHLAGRAPTTEELNLLARLYEQQRALFAAGPEAATKLIRIGDRPPDPALPTADVAAATIVAQTILNLDATLWKR